MDETHERLTPDEAVEPAAPDAPETETPEDDVPA